MQQIVRARRVNVRLAIGSVSLDTTVQVRNVKSVLTVAILKELPFAKKPKVKKNDKQKYSANTKKDNKGQLKRVKAKTSSDKDYGDSDDSLIKRIWRKCWKISIYIWRHS